MKSYKDYEDDDDSTGMPDYVKCELIGGPKDGMFCEVNFEALRVGALIEFPEAVPQPIDGDLGFEKPYRSICYQPIIDEPGHLWFVGYRL